MFASVFCRQLTFWWSYVCVHVRDQCQHSSKLVFVTHTSILSTHIHDGAKRDQTHLHAAVNNRISVRICTSMVVNIRSMCVYVRVWVVCACTSVFVRPNAMFWVVFFVLEKVPTRMYTVLSNAIIRMYTPALITVHIFVNVRQRSSIQRACAYYMGPSVYFRVLADIFNV